MTHRTVQRGRLAVLAVVAPIFLLAAACGDDDDDASTGAGSGGGGGPSVELVTPSDGDEVSIPFDVQLEASEELGPTDSGAHHVHLYYDGVEEGTPGQDYDVVEADSYTVERDLSPGEHTITASLRNADHSPADAEQTITVTVGDGSGSGGGSGGSTGDDSGGSTTSTDDGGDGY
jgi:Big-like domain-containing protein